MKLPKSLQTVVSNMEGPNFGMNVTYFNGKHDSIAMGVSAPSD